MVHVTIIQYNTIIVIIILSIKCLIQNIEISRAELKEEY